MTAGRVPATPRAGALIIQRSKPRLRAQAAQGSVWWKQGAPQISPVGSNQELRPHPLMADPPLGGLAHLGSATERGCGLLWLHTFFAEAKIRQYHMSLWRREGRGKRVA